MESNRWRHVPCHACVPHLHFPRALLPHAIGRSAVELERLRAEGVRTAISRAARLDVAGCPAGPALLGVSSAASRRRRGCPGG
eukprot:6117604-Pyramimonas_sp.AAC.1